MTINSSYYANIRPEILSVVPESAKTILDVGCGYGFFGKNLKTPEREIWGTDITKGVEEEATKNCDRFVLCDITKDYNQFPQNYFDCITFNDVLEHLWQPQEILHVCKKLLTKNGVIISSIPNFLFYSNLKQMILTKDFKYSETGGILDNTHMRFYTKKSIIRLFEQSGYAIQTIKGINPHRRSPICFAISLLSLGYFKEIRYLQFLTIAKPSN